MAVPLWQMGGAPRPVLLRLVLADARGRGESFAVAWTYGVASVCRTAVEEEAWRAVFAGTREGWRRAYEGLPATPGELALAAVAPELIGDLDGDGLERRRCAWCDTPLEISRDPRAVYCSDRCRRRAHYHTVERTRGSDATGSVRAGATVQADPRTPMEALP